MIFHKRSFQVYIHLFLLFFSFQVFSQTVIFSDDFESDKGWTLSGEFERGAPNGLGGEHGDPDPGTAYSGSNVLGVDLSGLGAYPGDYETMLFYESYAAVSPLFNCTNYEYVVLKFQRWLNVEQDLYDEAFIEISTDGGASWNVVWENDNVTITESAWSLQTIDISAYAANESNVQIRFLLGGTDGSWQYSGWNVDDLEVTGHTVIWQEDFTYADNANTGNGNPAIATWNSDGGAPGVTVIGNRLQGVNTRSPNPDQTDWIIDVTDPIEIGGFTDVAVFMDISNDGNLDVPDYIRVQYNLDETGWNDIIYQTDDFANSTISVTGLSGTTLRIQAIIYCNNDDERYYIDNINVVGTPTNAGSTGDYYYSYQSGNWDEVSTWTHDPSGTTQTAADIPNAGDNVIILNSRTVTLDADEDTVDLDVTIRSGGILDQSTFEFTSGIAALRGPGTHKLASVNYPSVATNDFVDADGGTTEYYNAADFTFPAAQATYYHLTLDASGVIATQLSDITLNGDLFIKQGTYQINDNSANRRQLTINGDVTVNNAASLTIGSGNTDSGDISGGTAPFIDYYDMNSHRVVVYGDFTNNGTVSFTNQAYPVYNTFPANGMATLYFMGATNNKLTCNNTTDLYNLVLDKGIDQTYKLTVYSSSYQNFRLFGRNDQGGENGGGNPDLRKALWIRTGTLELTGLTVIPSLTEANTTGAPNGDFYIPVNGALQLNGSEVIVLSTADSYQEVNLAYGVAAGSDAAMGILPSGGTQSFSIYGKFQVDDGYFSTRESGGLITWSVASGQIVINGGEVDSKQFRAAGGAGGLASFTQNGGLFELRGRFQRIPTTYLAITDLVNAPINTTRQTGSLDGAVGTFNLSETTNVFNMSGGTIQIYDACGNAGWVFDVYSDAGNINVTGGTVEFIPTTGTGGDAAIQYIRSNSPFYNLTVNRSSSTTTLELNTYPLVVYNDLNLTSGVLTAADYNVTVGGNFNIENGTTYSSGDNTTIFDGANNQIFTINNAGTTAIKKLKVDKPAGSSLTLAGSFTTLSVQDSLIIYNAEIADGGNTIQLTTSGTSTTSIIYNSGLHTGTGNIEIADDDPSIITGDGTGIFGNINLNNTDALAAPVSLDEDISINGVLTFLQDKLLNIGTNSLTFGPSASVANAGTNRFIQTAGNASDGGVVMTVNSAKTYQYPIGVGTKYTPVQMDITNYSDDGYIQISLADQVLATTNPAGGEILTYYWRVRHQDFINVPDVAYQYTYDQTDVPGVETGYVQGKVLEETPYTRSVPGGSIDIINNLLSYNAVPLEKANYTAGDAARFGGDVLIYYTRDIARQPNWTNGNAWTRSDILIDANGDLVIDEQDYHDSRQPAAGDYPDNGDVAVIGWVPWGNTTSSGNEGEPHGIWIDNITITCAEVVFTKMTDVLGNPVPRVYRSNFQFRPTLCINEAGGQLITSMVRGEGMFWNRMSNPDFDLMDITEFAQEDSSYVLYENFTNDRYYTNTPPEFPNLMVSNDGWGNNDRDITFTRDILTTGNFEIFGDANIVLNDAATGDITIGRNLVLFENNTPVEGNASGGGAELAFRNSGEARTVTVYGDILNYSTGGNAANGGIIRVDNPNATAPLVDHTLNLYGSYLQNSADGGLDGLYLFTGNNEDRISLYLLGDTSATISKTSGDDPVLYRLVVDKGTSQSTSVEIATDFTLGGPTSGVGVPKALDMKNGTLNLNNAGIDIDLNTGDDDFIIPSTSCLQMTDGTVNVSGDNTGIYLDGKLLLDGGTVDMNSGAGNGNNYIEYSGSGNSELIINSGYISVGSQIRRNPATTAGVLKYSQYGGNLTINGRNSLTTNAKLEILNAGSEFNMSGGTINIVRGSGGSTYGDLYLRPGSASVTGGEIIFDPNGSGDQDYLLDANTPVWDLTINGSGGDDANVELLISPLELNGDLNLQTATSYLDANINFDIDVTLNGDFTNNGSYLHRDNHTYFTGGAQSLLGTSNTSYYDLTVNPVTSLSLSRDITVNNEMILSSGTLLCGDYSVYVKGDISNNANYTDNNTGIVLNGSVLQYLDGTGTWGQLELDNNAGARLQNAITLRSDLLLTGGVLDINRYLLSLGANSNIVGSGYNNTKMITSDGVFSNVGISKVFSDTDDGTTMLFPLGTSGKYTPATLTLTNIGSTGSFRINNINSNHPGVLDPTNVLDYFWEVESSGITGFDGILSLNYTDGDVKVTGVNSEADYIAAALLLPGTSWTKATAGVDDATDRVYEAGDSVLFYFAGVSSLSGEYTCGIDAALPDNVPEFTSNTVGNWSNPAHWTQTGGDPYSLSGGPNGFIVTIRAQDTITTDVNYASAYRAAIDGRLVIPSTTYGHNLGTVSGSGILALENGTLPAGRFATFLDCSNNATLEYGGAGSYTLIADLYSSIPNLHFKGTGSRVLPNKDLTICNQLLIDGPLLDNSVNNRSLTIQGTMERYNTGAFLAGSGTAATVTFAGGAAQTLGGSLGDFSGANAFNNFEIDNSAGLIINTGGAIEIDGNLLLTDGIIRSSSSSTITITNTAISCVTPTGGSTTSYIDGPLTKRINQGDNFSFPVGKGSIAGNKINLSATRTGTQYWTVEYFNPNATSGDFTAPLTYVNNDEYWTVSSVSGSEAIINLDWDASSDLTPLMTQYGLSDMRVAQFNNSSSEWEALSSSASGNNAAGTVFTTTRISIPSSGSSDFTTSCINVVKPRAQFTPTGAICGAASGIPVSFNYSGAIPFNYTLDYEIDGVPQTQLNITSGDVTAGVYILATSTIGVYELTGFTYNSGADNGVVDPTTIEVYALPTIADIGSDGGSDDDNISDCGTSSVAGLPGNNPTVGTGLWSVIAGSGGSFVAPTVYNSEFNGTNGSTYQLEWEITNGACTSTDTMTVTFPLLAQQPDAFISSSATVCQTTNGVVYTVPNDLSVTYTWSFNDATGKSINGTGNSITVDFDATATSSILSVNATNGCGTSADRSIAITVNALPNLTLTVDPALDSICEGANTQFTINFTSGSPNYNFVVQITDENLNATTDNISGVSTNTFSYTPATLPVWVDDGSPDTEYLCRITTITDGNTCTNTDLGNEKIVVFKIPSSGPQYHVNNTWEE